MTVLNPHRDVTLAQLKLVTTPPPMGPIHQPVPHSTLLETLMEACAQNFLHVTNANVSVGGSKEFEGQMYYDVDCCGTLDLQEGGDADMGCQLGFWSSNAFKRAVHLVAGHKVFVCSNLQISGDAILVNRKHTHQLDLRPHLVQAIRAYLKREEESKPVLERLKNHEWSSYTWREGRNAKEIAYNIWADRTIPQTACRKAHDIFFRDSRENPAAYPEVAKDHDNAWGLYQAYTRSVRDYPLHRRMYHAQAIDVPFRKLVGVEK